MKVQKNFEEEELGPEAEHQEQEMQEQGLEGEEEFYEQEGSIGVSRCFIFSEIFCQTFN